MNKDRVDRYMAHLKVHEYFYLDCDDCIDRLNMCDIEGNDHIYCENDSDCCVCGC